jgi:hypothetical protein
MRPIWVDFRLSYVWFFQIVIVVFALHMQTGDISRTESKKVKEQRPSPFLLLAVSH